MDREISRRRTFAIISHPDAGKTTLTEKFLLYGGAVQLAGSVTARKNQRATTSDWIKERVWSLGPWSRPVAWVAIFWIVVLMILFSWPTSGNISWPFMVATVAFLLVYYFGWARTRFVGPHVMGREEELTEIELEFQHAAQELGGSTM